MLFSDVAKLPIHEIFTRPKKIADVGIEIEMEGQGLPGSDTNPSGLVPHWSSKGEGSLQHGVEYVTKPIKADVVKTYVDNLRKHLQQIGAVIKPSYRCSTHVHVNFSPETLADLLGFVAVFTMFEPLLLSLCGPQRDGNLFCMSSYDTGDIVDAMDNICRRICHVKDQGYGYDRGKYAALNLGRLADLMTAEVRCFSLSVDGDEVQKWVNWLLAMKDMAKAETDKTYRELWKKVRQNPQWYAMKIFGQDVWGIPNISNMIDIGTETAYEITKVLKRHYKAVEQEKPANKAKKKYSGFAPSDVMGLDDFQPEPENW